MCEKCLVLWCRVLGLEDERKSLTIEIRMLCMICGKTRRDGISNKTIRDMSGVEKIVEFLRKQRLWWFGYVK